MTRLTPENERNGQFKQTAVVLVRGAQDSEREALGLWLEKLLDIHDGDGSALQKTKDAVSATKETKIVWRLLKLIAKEIRRLGWVERSNRTKWATVAAGASLAVFGGQSAGIAALGGAIGVPLWVVFGGGAAFARILLDEIQRDKANRPIAPAESSTPEHGAINGSYIDITPKD